jgi:hypothetical protein
MYFLNNIELNFYLNISLKNYYLKIKKDAIQQNKLKEENYLNCLINCII